MCSTIQIFQLSENKAKIMDEYKRKGEMAEVEIAVEKVNCYAQGAFRNPPGDGEGWDLWMSAMFLFGEEQRNLRE